MQANESAISFAEATASATRSVALLRLYAAPVLTAACLIGAVLILTAAIRKRRQLQAKHFVLVLLTLADAVTILSSAFFNQFLYYGLSIPMPHAVSQVACKLWSLVWVLGNGLSANLLCFLAVDRLYAVSRPLQHRAATSRGRYCLLLAGFCAPFLAAGVFGAATFRVYEYLGQRHCYIDVGLPAGLGIAYQAYATLIANGTVGSCFLLAANAVLACRLCAIARSRRKRWRLPGAPPTETTATTGGPAICESTFSASTATLQTMEQASQTRTWPGHRKKHCKRQQNPSSRSAVRTGVTLMAASAAHLAGSLPRAIAYLIAGIIEYGDLQASSELEAARLQLVFQLAANFDYLFYANCSLNWLIYCANVPELRPW